MVKIFKRLLFLGILGLIGFGIYIGISKLVDIIKTPSTPSPIVVTKQDKENTSDSNTGKILIKTGITVAKTGTKGNTSGSITVVKSGAVIPTTATKEEAGFFARIWSTIKGWFCFDDTTTKTSVTTGSKINTGKQMTGAISSGALLSGDIVNTGNELEEFIEDVSTGTTNKQTTNTVSDTTIKTTTITKKPSTTTQSTTTKTNNSSKDPILDALF